MCDFMMHHNIFEMQFNLLATPVSDIWPKNIEGETAKNGG
jgi:hypothetical protein